MEKEQVVLLLANGMTVQGERPSEEEARLYRQDFMGGTPAHFRALKNVRIQPTGQTLEWLVILKTEIVGQGPYQIPAQTSKPVSTPGLDPKALEDITRRSRK